MNLGEIGKRVRLRRVELGWTQQQLARKAKVALGTVQALEDAANRKHPRQTTARNLEKIAKALERSIDDLLKNSADVAPTDPLYVGLSKEDLLIAHRFHDADTPTRLLTQRVLRGEITDVQVAFAERIAKLTSDDRTTLDGLIRGLEEAEHAESLKEQPRQRPNTKA